MNIARITVPRPVATTMFFICVIILGIIAFQRLPVDLMPDITFPRLTISTEYEGVGPQEIEQLISVPIERAVASIEGVEELTSQSGEGQSQIRVAFVWGTDLAVAAEDI
jgi:HAE1 family hydrophobic/amphiphilic exporter-1